MTTMEIAKKLVDLCRQGKNAEALDTLFADDVVSVEAGVPPGMEPACRASTGSSRNSPSIRTA